jgi:hypothetical protein
MQLYIVRSTDREVKIIIPAAQAKAVNADMYADLIELRIVSNTQKLTELNMKLAASLGATFLLFSDQDSMACQSCDISSNEE